MQPTINITDRIKKFIDTDATKIEGWFFHPDIFTFTNIFDIQDKMGVTGDIVEVGVYHAKSLALLSLLKKSEQTLFGFDYFPDDMQQIAENNLEKFGDTNSVRFLKGFTSELDQTYLDDLFPKPISFLHIDAGHEYFEVLEQLQIFSPYLCDRAIIAMDDYQDREFPGVGAAVLDFCEIDRPRRFVPFFAGANKMYLCAPSFAPAYQLAMLESKMWNLSWRLTQVKDYQILIPFSKVPMTPDDIKQRILNKFHPRRDIDVSAKLSSIYSQLNYME
jgi:hypothetical protein